MDIVEIRRARLREWFADRSLPPKEKSYLSQLMSGTASFGEKAARRLEADLGMGDGYLDRAPEEEKEQIDSFLRGPGIGYVSADEIVELIQLYKQATPTGRKFIIRSARAAERTSGERTSAANDQP